MVRTFSFRRRSAEHGGALTQFSERCSHLSDLAHFRYQAVKLVR